MATVHVSPVFLLAHHTHDQELWISEPPDSYSQSNISEKEPTDRIRSNRLCNRWYDIAGETWLVVVDVV